MWEKTDHSKPNCSDGKIGRSAGSPWQWRGPFFVVSPSGAKFGVGRVQKLGRRHAFDLGRASLYGQNDRPLTISVRGNYAHIRKYFQNRNFLRRGIQRGLE